MLPNGFEFGLGIGEALFHKSSGQFEFDLRIRLERLCEKSNDLPRSLWVPSLRFSSSGNFTFRIQLFLQK
jgi:hypothetical protein